jgi:molybdopterin-binding protein
MSLSARNRLSGTVQRVETSGLMAEVVVELDGGETVTAVIISGSAERLGLEAGSAVDAVIKATEVMIEAD